VSEYTGISRSAYPFWRGEVSGSHASPQDIQKMMNDLWVKLAKQKERPDMSVPVSLDEFNDLRARGIIDEDGRIL
jgi:hypothetical protein